MDVESFIILSMQKAWKVMSSCVITTVKVNEYQRKSDFLQINFIISRQLIFKKKSYHKYVSLWLTECILLDNVVFRSIHVMKVAGISPFNHFKMYKLVLNTHCSSIVLCHAII